MTGSAEQLYKLAEWYRAFAELGCTGEKAARLKLAEYLEREAQLIEAASADQRQAATVTRPAIPAQEFPK